jgi:hypothetical protein
VEANVHETRRILGLLDDRREDPDDLFLRYHLHRLDELNSSLHDATSKHEVRIGTTMFDVTDWLMKSSFRVGAASIFRAVMPTSEADLEFFLVFTAAGTLGDRMNTLRTGHAARSGGCLSLSVSRSWIPD